MKKTIADRRSRNGRMTHAPLQFSKSRRIWECCRGACDKRPQTDLNRILRFTLVWIAIAVVIPCCGQVLALDISDYYSPWNLERPVRPRTNYIILHTTEGPKKGSLRKVHANGEAHYLVDRSGHVYRIIEKKRIASHAGRSMWNGRTNLDTSSIGIEVVGYHDRDITAAQYRALKELLSQLKRIYRIPDERVLTHSMIAYSAPNRWHGKSRRGRKRCGMLFARKSVRRKLGLDKQPLYDPDVRAGRLAVGDPYLAELLYASARDQEMGDSEIENIKEIGPDGKTAQDIAGDEYNSKTTIYFLPDGKVKRGDEFEESDLQALPEKTGMLVGYVYGGYITGKRSAFDVCGKRWNFPSTFYRFPDGSIRSGNTVNENEIPKSTLVFFRN